MSVGYRAVQWSPFKRRYDLVVACAIATYLLSFFIVGKRCYKSENAACQAARCKAPLKCTPEGAGPTQMKCAK